MLGPLEVDGASGAVALGGGKPRALLALLLLRANQPVSAEHLAVGLWGEDAPPSSIKTIHVHVSRLRKALGDPDVIATVPAGYRLRVRPGELDAERFEALIAEARDALADGRADRAATKLREALGLCRGPPLPEFALEPFAQPEIARLEEQRLAALEARVDADLRCGRHAEIVPELGQLAEAHPAREQLAYHLMVALYRCERHADALEVFQRVRCRLDEELGLEPGPDLKKLQQQILKQAPELELTMPAASAHDEATPLPAPLGRARSMPYVGRTDERALLRRAVAGAREGATQIVLLGGEPGIGKTRLAAAAALDAHAAGFAVGWGGSSEGLRAPYGTWITALSHLVQHAPEDVVAPVMRKHGRQLSRLLPGLAAAADSPAVVFESDPETERYLLFTAVVDLLEALSARQPAAIVLDDLQWSDTPSLTLLQHVAGTTGDVRLLLLVTYRDTDAKPDAPLVTAVGDLLRVDGVERLILDGLTVDDIATLMTEVAGHDIGSAGRDLAAEIRDETGGNAFFVGQILRHLTESGAIVQDDAGRWQVRATLAELGVPGTVRDVVLGRIARLGEGPQRVLTLAAVIGRTFDLELLERLTEGGPGGDPLPALEAALGASMVTEPSTGRFAFAHAIINHTLYSQLSAARRSRLHCRVAEAVAELPGDHVAEIAHHWLAADSPAHVDDAIRWSKRAGDRALEHLAPDEAMLWYAQGVKLTGDDPELAPHRCDLLIGLGEAGRQIGGAFRDVLLEAGALAERLGDHERLTRAVLANTLGPFGAAGPPDHARVATLQRALDAVPPDWPWRPRMLAVLGKEVYYGGDPAEGCRLAEQALGLARRRGDRRELARVTAFTTAISPVAPFATHAALVDELARMGHDLDDPELCFRAANAGFILAMHDGDRRRLDVSLATMLALADAIGQPILRWTALWSHSASRCLGGDLPEATRLTLKAAALAHEHGIPEGLVITFGQLLAIRTEEDRLGELVESLDRHIASNPQLRLLRLTRGFIDAETGLLDEAAEVLAQQGADGFGFGFDRTRAFNLARCADIALRLEARDVGQDLYDRLLPYRRQFATAAGISSRGSVELNLGRLAGLLGHVDRAVEHFAAAEAAHRALDAPLLLARTFLARGAWLLSLGGRDEAAAASDLLVRSVALARRHGSAAIEREACVLLGEPVGVRPRP
ncbi:MAG TPA: BTAD domain-containing putative transcriptional regulator [Baekduia sp.]|nr:BTAD domain-containing putative transcriptional regulator [Baekduia sp.]